MVTITAKDLMRNAVIAQGELGNGVFELESAYYFDPELVNADNLVLTQRVYVCAYKGKCYWLDLQTDSGVFKDVGWIYTEPRAGYEHIKDKDAFAFGMRPGVVVQKS